MIEVIVGVLVLLGGFFAFIAALGVIRMPDTLTRMHASTKAGTLASILIMSAATLHFFTVSVSARATLIILFMMLTAPLSAHMLGRSAVRNYNKD